MLFYLHHQKKLGELGLSSDSPLLFASCLFHNDTAETKMMPFSINEIKDVVISRGTERNGTDRMKRKKDNKLLYFPPAGPH